jgi:hypothetical protein
VFGVLDVAAGRADWAEIELLVNSQDGGPDDGKEVVVSVRDLELFSMARRVGQCWK